MLQAYNYLIGVYPSKKSMMYPVKNRKELKRVYENIVSLSKRTPFCKINLSRENQEYTFGVKEAALELRTTLLDMFDPDISGFHSKTVSVSDEGTLSARLLKDNTEDLPDIIEIKVNSLAAGQINIGRELLDNTYSLIPGEYYFDARVDDQTYSLTFIQQERTNNLETLGRMAEFLNQNVPGICAEVEGDEKRSYSRIRIASDMTGKYGERSFSFEDKKVLQNGIAELFGMDWMAKAAEPAAFELNDQAKQAATNIFTLENMLHISLHDIGEDPVMIRITYDSSRILETADLFLSAYNRIIDCANRRMLGHTEHYGAGRLAGELMLLKEAFEEELTACGIQATEVGTLALESASAVRAAEEGGMESFFTRENGFITNLMEKAEAIAINPMEYLDKTIILYPNTMKNTLSNPYITSMYSGLFFNSYC